MITEPDSHGLARQATVAERRTNTMQSEYRTDIARLAEYISKRDVEAAKRDMEAAKRDKDNLRWLTTLFLGILGAIGIATAVLGFLIRLPPPPPV